MIKDMLLVFGTSADPLHKGHTQLVIDAVKALHSRGQKVARVILIPVFRHHNIQEGVKRSLPLTFEHRFDICHLAAQEIYQGLQGLVDRVEVSDLEWELVSQNNRPNFTAETMTVLRKRIDPSYELGFLIGSDSFTGEKPSFGQWFHWQDLIKDTALVISPRQGFQPNLEYIDYLGNIGARVIYLDELEVNEISSREIRERLEKGEKTSTLVREGLLSPAIAAYIEERELIPIWKEIDTTIPAQAIKEKLMENDDLETRIGKHLFQKKLTLGLAESCTGGLIGHLITNVPGSSEYFMGSVVSYAYQAKVNLLGVSWDTLKTYGAVSSETVLEMSRGARKTFNSDIGLSVCCIAGPGGATPSKPVGTSWCALSTPEGDWSYHFLLEGSRVSIKEQLAKRALEVLLNYLESEN